MVKDRNKEYEAIGRIIVDFETLTGQIKFKLFEQMMYLGLDFEKGQNSVDILLAKMGIDELNKKFNSIYNELFSKEDALSKKIEIFTKCVTKLSEIRNLYAHAEWFIGYSELTGTEEEISRGFNDRYGTMGLKRYRVLFDHKEFSEIDLHIRELIRFISGIEFTGTEFSISEASQEINESRLNNILASFNGVIEKCDVV